MAKISPILTFLCAKKPQKRSRNNAKLLPDKGWTDRIAVSNRTQAQNQLTLWQSAAPNLFIAAVPESISLENDRYFIHLDNWFAAIQLSRDEADRAVAAISQQRFENLTKEIVWEAIEQVIDKTVSRDRFESAIKGGAA
ncbi:hypothetical protein H6F89_28575 [Cyanobacteria bacterium FACHB-63]|nr:hypothetical protein [Cyanobacteria bacterium FACHB-63]